MSAAAAPPLQRTKNDNKIIRIRRIKHGEENPFFLIARKMAQDRSLSFEARGMLLYLLSKPDDWKLHPKDLEQGCGENRVYSILKELRDKRYIKYTVERQRGKIVGHIYDVYEEPLDDFPDVAKPDVENHHTYILKNPQETEETKRYVAACSSDVRPAVITLPEIDPDDLPYETPFIQEPESRIEESKETSIQPETVKPEEKIEATGGAAAAKEKPAKSKKNNPDLKYGAEDNKRRSGVALTHALWTAKALAEKSPGRAISIARRTTDPVCDVFDDLTGEEYQGYTEWYDAEHPEWDKTVTIEGIIRHLPMYLAWVIEEQAPIAVNARKIADPKCKVCGGDGIAIDLKTNTGKPCSCLHSPAKEGAK